MSRETTIEGWFVPEGGDLSHAVRDTLSNGTNYLYFLCNPGTFRNFYKLKREMEGKYKDCPLCERVLAQEISDRLKGKT